MFERKILNHHGNQEATLLFGEPTNGKFYETSNTAYASAVRFAASLSHVILLMSTSFSTT